MKTTQTTRNLLLAGGFVATAAAGFSIGRMGGSHDSSPGAHSGGSSATGNYSAAGGFSAAERERLGVAVTTDGGGGRIVTVGEVTGGQPLEDWLKKLMAQDDELYRMQNFMKLLEALNTPEDIKAALKAMNGARGGGRGGAFGGGGRFTEFAMLMAKFTQLDAKGAMAFAQEQEGGEKVMMATTALRTWSRLAPDAALEWAKTEGVKLQADFGREWRGQGGPGGGPGGTGNEEGPKDNIALLSVVNNLAKTDLDKALSEATSMELGRMGDRTVQTLASEFISQRGSDAARKYADTLPAGPFRDQFIGDVAGRLAQTDPKGTADWVMKMETGDVKRRALGQAIQEWAQKDAAAAGGYLATVAPSTDTDAARSELAGQVGRSDPKTAWAWAQTITDPERQYRTMEGVARSWVRSGDTAGLQQAVAASSLSNEAKVRLTQPQTGGGFRGGGGVTGGGGGFNGAGATGGGGRRGR